MNGNSHLLFSTSLSVSIALNADKILDALSGTGFEEEFLRFGLPSVRIFIVMGGIIGGVFPDVDNSKSHVGQLSVPISTMIERFSGMFGKKGVWHRGILHDPFIYIIGLFLSLIYYPVLLGFFIGAISHVYLDLYTPIGIPWLFCTKRLHLAKIPSGSREAIVLTWIHVLLSLFIGIMVHLGLLY